MNNEERIIIKLTSSLTSMKIYQSNLCDYSDAYIHVIATITVSNTEAQGLATNNTNKKPYLRVVLHLLILKAK